jgi:hypothetical protein
MRLMGFSTGALARGDFRGALRMLEGKKVCAVELSALRQDELAPLVRQLPELDLRPFKYISFHAPSSMEPSFETTALQLLEEVAARKWPIIVHPDAMHTPTEWNCLGECLCIENMDKRKPVGQTTRDLARYFEMLPRASLCFDIGHARQVDPTMSEAAAILRRFRSRIQQLHVSEVNTQSKHDALTLESILAFQKVSHLIPPDCPAILESKVEESQIEDEIQNTLMSLNTESFVSGKLVIEGRSKEGDYVVRRPRAERISDHEPTQVAAIERAREIDRDAAIFVEHVRNANSGHRDKMRKSQRESVSACKGGPPSRCEKVEPPHQ